jgi:ribose/xylose/arabinose/galactoside ABC-type transport system permease subunit
MPTEAAAFGPSAAPAAPNAPAAGPRSTRLATPERVLFALIVAEIVWFSLAGTNFLTLDNGLEILRASTEIGLLALALTPVILTGGIDLSCGALLGLCAVVFGAVWRDAGQPVAIAAAAALAVGLIGGGLNAWMVAGFGRPALIVTLGTASLFRGLAEGLTGGAVNYSGFPDGFLHLGQGYVLGVPTQAWLLLAAIAVVAVLVHAATIGRALRAIGYSPDGARFAGIPVGRRLALVYLLSGAAAGLAGLIYAARLGQARADAGTGFELSAITAVVLGGTSIFGGRGTVGGTLLGLLALGVLANGLRLADQPAELAGVLTGVLLIVAIGVGARRRNA